MNCGIVSGGIEHKESLDRKNKSLKKTIKCTLTYPLPSCVAVDAKRQSAQTADYQHLEELDLLWTEAILANKAQKDHQDRALKDRDFLLDSTIGMGVYNNEAANTFVEKLMRYPAVSLSLLHNHIIALENKVTCHYPSL